jgi:hypothetical protein
MDRQRIHNLSQDMSQGDFHIMTAVLIEERQVMRYTCTVCPRCLEDGPEGITVIHRGDAAAMHRGGRIAPGQGDIEQEPRAPRRLH